MTVIRPNAISGITSLTAQGDVINFFKSDGTLSGLEIGGARINATGISTFTSIKVGTAQTLDASGINVTGVITATSFKGDGSTLTGVAATSNVSTNAIVNSGVTTVSAGSTSAPSISPTGDTDTGIFFPSADTIAFGEGGAEAARFDSSGRFGIGTASPNEVLDVNGNISTRIGSGGLVVAFETDSTRRNRLQIGGDSAGGFINSTYSSDGSGAIIFRNVGTEAARIDGSGRLLVGTTSTSAADVKFVAQVSSGTTGPSSGTAPKGIAISHPGGDGSYGGLWFSEGFGDDQGISGIAGFRTSSYFTELRFYTNNTNAARSFSERMRIASDGSISSVIPGGSTLYPRFGCRAWVNFDGTGTVAIRASGNVSSITDNGTGDYTVNFTTAMADANYATVVTVGTSATNDANCPQTRTDLSSASGARVYMKGTNAAFFDVNLLAVAVFR